ncbi:MAG: zf-HC2 domain-containing protein [Candidatus Marinimicrobia bacterium]|nr:zf-HC2 domain-containing protein [Candidatus Neomarinimicrobiota bacterium]
MQNNECIRICDHFSEYQENTLSSEIKAGVDNHLSLCGACNELFRELSQVLENLHNLPTIHTRSDFTSTLMERIDAMNQESFWQKIYSSSYTRVAGYAIAAGLVVALGLNLWMDPIVPLNPKGRQNYATEQKSQIPGAVTIAEGLDSTRGLQDDSLRAQQETIHSATQSLQLVNGTE